MLPPFQSPLLVHANTSKHSSRVGERFSGLWEFYYDQHGTVVKSEAGDSVRGEGQGSQLKNIRGFLLKRRKSPLKGWHKVRARQKGKKGGRAIVLENQNYATYIHANGVNDIQPTLSPLPLSLPHTLTHTPLL